MRRTNRYVVATALAIGGIGITLNLDSDKHADSSVDQSQLDHAQIDQTYFDQVMAHTQPQFEISWLRGELQLSGHTVSRRHEQNLLTVAATSFPGQPVSTAFEPFGIVPEHWEDTTLQVLYTLAPAHSARARLSADNIDIRAVADDDIAWRSRFEALAATLPAEISLAEDTIAVVESSSAASLCDQAFQTFDTGPISFEESSAVFRSSAFPRLDRAIALADACRSAVITITGHTDASGNALENEKLSLRRAQAVADYMANVGIDRVRLHVRGAGSSAPVADNKTRYGRSLNRRIEIGFKAH